MMMCVGLIQVATLLSSFFSLEHSVDLLVITGEKGRRMTLGR
jgi:hypothetical protein